MVTTRRPAAVTAGERMGITLGKCFARLAALAQKKRHFSEWWLARQSPQMARCNGISNMSTLMAAGQRNR